MDTAKYRPVCGEFDLKVLSKVSFSRPPALDAAAVASLPYAERSLRLFFDEICAGEDNAEISMDMCPACGLIFSNPRFSKQQVSTRYLVGEEKDNPRAAAGSSPPPNADERSARIFNLISRALGDPPRSLRVLDYGGARGAILQSFMPENHCCVLDYLEYDLPGGATYLGRDLEALGPDDLFDLILLCHTLEHVPDPLQLATAVGSYLSESGLLYVEVPLGAFREWRAVREPLTHVNFFSEESLVKCMGLAGLRVLSVETRFQWSCSGRSWCINLLCRPGSAGSARPPKWKSTRRQMWSPFYYPRMVVKKAGQMLPRMGNRHI
jgi:Methyltransferase domain